MQEEEEIKRLHSNYTHAHFLKHVMRVRIYTYTYKAPEQPVQVGLL